MNSVYLPAKTAFNNCSTGISLEISLCRHTTYGQFKIGCLRASKIISHMTIVPFFLRLGATTKLVSGHSSLVSHVMALMVFSTFLRARLYASTAFRRSALTCKPLTNTSHKCLFVHSA